MAWWLYVYHRSARNLLLVTLLATAVHAALGVRFGATLGRRAFGLRLVEAGAPAAQAQPLPWRTAAWHLMGNAFCWLSFGAGFYWMVVDGHGRSWANLVSRTVTTRRR